MDWLEAGIAHRVVGVATTPAANFATSFASIVDTGVNDTGGKFATGVNNTGGKYCHRCI